MPKTTYSLLKTPVGCHTEPTAGPMAHALQKGPHEQSKTVLGKSPELCPSRHLTLALGWLLWGTRPSSVESCCAILAECPWAA